MRSGLALAALFVAGALCFAPAAQADFGATAKQVAGPALHPSVLSCGATTGCVITSDRHVVPKAENNRVITAVDVWLPVGQKFSVDVLVMKPDVAGNSFKVLDRSGITRRSVVGAGASTPRLRLKSRLQVRTGQRVGLNVRAFSGAAFRSTSTIRVSHRSFPRAVSPGATPGSATAGPARCTRAIRTTCSAIRNRS